MALFFLKSENVFNLLSVSHSLFFFFAFFCFSKCIIIYFAWYCKFIFPNSLLEQKSTSWVSISQYIWDSISFQPIKGVYLGRSIQVFSLGSDASLQREITIEDESPIYVQQPIRFCRIFSRPCKIFLHCSNQKMCPRSQFGYESILMESVHYVD